MRTDKKIISYAALRAIRRRATRAHKKVVLTTGCYDLLHLGHMVHLDFCKSKGDILVVTVGSDATVRHLKGEGRPKYSQKVRARMLAALVSVDYVVMSKEFGRYDHVKVSALLKPDIYVMVKGDPALPHWRQVIGELGGQVIECKRVPPRELKKQGISTTQIIQNLSS